MDINVLINILIQAKGDELKKVKILRKDINFDNDMYCLEDISGISYDFDEDSVILFPKYFS